MRDWYDNLRLEDIFDERANTLPNGPLGLLEPPEVKLVAGLSSEAVRFLPAYFAGKIGTMDFARDIEAIRLKENQPLPS